MLRGFDGSEGVDDVDEDEDEDEDEDDDAEDDVQLTAEMRPVASKATTTSLGC
jgi:hypothetical protein